MSLNKPDRPDIVGLCRSAGLEQVDVGTTYTKPVPESMRVPLVVPSGITPAAAAPNGAGR